MSSSIHGMKPAPPPKPQQIEEDDWETDPDFVNNLSEKQSRWGAKTVEGSGHQESIRLDKLREDVLKGDEIVKEKKLAEMPKPSAGYGGKFGLETDRIDKCAAGFDYKGKVEPHASQRDYAKGFGGAYGVQTDRVDKSALGWDNRDQLVKHESQTDYKKGFGGQFGVQTDRKDKSAAGWEDRDQLTKHASQTDYKKGFGGEFGIQSDRKDKSAAGWEERDQLTKHESQTDYKKGFGGQFGVQSDRKDKSAAGWEEHEQMAKHESQIDYKKGFGGQFGVQTERQDKSAMGWEARDQLTKHASQTDYKKGFGGIESSTVGGGSVKDKLGAIEAAKMDENRSKGGQQNVEDGAIKRGGGASSLRSKFEQMALQGDQQNAERAREERERRKHEDEELRKRQAEEEQQRQKRLDQQWAEREQNEEINGGTQKAVEEDIAAPKRASFPKTRPSIGVRLPFATAPAEDNKILPNERDEVHKIEEGPETIPEQVRQPPIQVLPTNVGQGYGGMPVSTLLAARRRSEEEEAKKTQEEEDEWKEEEEVPHQNVHPPQQSENSKIISSAPAPTHQVQSNAAQQNAIPAQQQPNAQPQYELPPAGDDYSQAAGATATQEPNPPADPAPSSAAPLMAIALYEYEQQDDDEIGFDVNDMITDIEQIDAGWWRGTCKGRFGLFPANYVQLMHR